MHLGFHGNDFPVALNVAAVPAAEQRNTTALCGP